MQNLRVSLVQAATHWHDPDANMAMFAERIRPLAGQTDLIVLTETLLSGFTRDTASQAEGMDGRGVAWMLEMAARSGAALAGSLLIAEQGRVYNRLIFARPDGTLEHYDKRHLFRMAGEHERYAAGRRRVVLEWQGWRICPMVCYDLRFPVWCRNRQDYDLLLFVANWPAPRRHAWRSLLVARAIENLAWVVGVNRVGRDGNGLDYAGDSLVVDPLGTIVADLGDREQVLGIQLDAALLAEHRQRFPAHLDADRFELLMDPACGYGSG